MSLHKKTHIYVQEITLSRHKTVSLGVARSIAKKAGWPE